MLHLKYISALIDFNFQNESNRPFSIEICCLTERFLVFICESDDDDDYNGECTVCAVQSDDDDDDCECLCSRLE